MWKSAVAVSVLALGLGTVPAHAAVTPGGIALVSWSMPDTPTQGRSSITFPITVNKAKHADGYYYAQQFDFVGVDQVGYIGLQPRADNAQGTVLHAAFSSFVPGTSTGDSHCSNGADGGPGVSCAVDFAATIGHRYDMKVTRTQTRTWSGTARDTVTGSEVHIGTWTLPAPAQGIGPDQVGFVEYYDSVANCRAMSATSVTFGHPFDGSTTGTTKPEYEYGNCKGQANYSASAQADGAHVSVGFSS